MVGSFGRRPGPAEDQVVPIVAGPVVLPPVQMPPVTVPVTLVVDVESLAYASDQLSQMVYQAVREGFERAMRDLDEEAGERGEQPVDG